MRQLNSARLLILTILLLVLPATALERQPNADYHARRVALSHKTNGGVVVLFAAVEAEGPNALYGFRQDNNFYYLTGLTEPGAAVLIAPEVAGDGDKARPYTEILFLPGRNYSEEQWTGPRLGPDDPEARRKHSEGTPMRLPTWRARIRSAMRCA